MQSVDLKKVIEELKPLIEDGNKEGILNALSELHLVDVAEILDILSFNSASYVLSLLSDQSRAKILVDLESDIQQRIITEYSCDFIANHIIPFIDSDDAADIINELEKEKQKEVLSLIQDFEKASNIDDLLMYSEDSAGGIMAKEYIQVRENWTISQCIQEVRSQVSAVKKVYVVYVVDQDEVLKGLVTLKQLLLHPDNKSIADITKTDLITIKVDQNQEEAVELMKKYDLIALPAIDSLGRLSGVITIDDAVDILNEEAERDYQMASGLAEDVESDDSIKDITKARLPWLVVGLAGGLLGAMVMGIFDIEKHWQLALFAPLIAAMGGNVGIQSAAIIVQGLAGNNLGVQTTKERLFKETIIALINGLVCSILALICSYWIIGDWGFALAVALSLIAVIVFAALFGTSVPLVLHRFGIDPALATGPFITTANDVFGLIIYFYLAQSLLV